MHDINIQSEIGELTSVIIHTPGPEVENMTPLSAERALYSDILNLAVVNSEYHEFKSILKLITQTYEIKTLLTETLEAPGARKDLLSQICQNEHIECLEDYFLNLPADRLAAELIEGVPINKNTLTKFLSNERYTLQPLHNFFFTRDAAMCFNQEIFISRMGNQVREREALIMEVIFRHHPALRSKSLVPSSHLAEASPIYFEGGDFLIISENIILIGIGARTTSQGVDFVIDHLRKNKSRKHIIVQQLPLKPESFIHLDMVFTVIDLDLYMIYEPIILNQYDYQTVHIILDNGQVESIREEKNIPAVLQKLGFEGQLALCGGKTDDWIQEREQWHSGTNFFSIGPGRVLGYNRNYRTLEELNKRGMAILPAADILAQKTNLADYEKYVISVAGSELARGGGGCRCMTMPLSRKPIS